MNKVIAIKVKNLNNGYDEIPITALAQNVYWNNNLDLNLKQHIIGNIKTDSNDATIPLQTQINDLNDSKADIDSPVFTGTPTIDINGNEQSIATQNYVDTQIEGQLKESNLQTEDTRSNLLSNDPPTNVTNRQYPVEFDYNGYLSVNVPWTDTVFSSSIENLWTGNCTASSEQKTKIINLDESSSFPSQLSGNEMLAIYFKERNTSNNPQLKINNIDYSIGILKNTDNGITIENITLSNNVEPFYNFGSGLKFFVYKKNYDGQNNNCWLLSNTDYLAISYLKDNKADIESPTFTGAPKIKVITNGEDSLQKIATQDYVDNIFSDKNYLTKSYLQNPEEVTNLSSTRTSVQNRQYPVVFDGAGKLSVNVPWVNPEGTLNNIQKLWTGICETQQNYQKKVIILDNENNNYGELIEIGEDESIVVNSNILIYFKQGNNRISPTIAINGLERLEKDILYQSGPNSYSKLEEDPYYKWGPGFKIFTYVKYKENDIDKDGWVISSFDGLIIKNLNERLLVAENILENKANLNSPEFNGIPTTTHPDGNTNNQITTVKYVQSECSKVLKADENYAFQLKSQNNDRSIFAVDWNGNANGIDLKCFTTQGIRKTRLESTIIGRYNAIVKNASGLYCGDNIFCSNTLLVGGPDISYDSGDYIFIIGGGTDNENRFNALAVTPRGGLVSSGNYNNISTNITIGQTPSEHYYQGGFILRDSKNFDYATFMHTYLNDGRLGFRLQVKRPINNVNIYNQLSMYIDDSGNPTVALSHPYAWQKAMYLDALYSSPSNPTYKTITISDVPVLGQLTSGAKQLQFFIPHVVTSGTPTITTLAIAMRGGSGQQYLWEASGPSNNTYTQLGTSPVVIWENGKTKRTNGVESVSCGLRRASGFRFGINFVNTLRKSNSTTVAQNNAPYGVSVSVTIELK